MEEMVRKKSVVIALKYKSIVVLVFMINLQIEVYVIAGDIRDQSELVLL